MKRMPFKKRFTEIIDLHVNKNGISGEFKNIQELADFAKMSRGCIYRFINGQNKGPGLGTLHKLSVALGYPPAFFSQLWFYCEGETNENPEDSLKIDVLNKKMSQPGYELTGADAREVAKFFQIINQKI